MSENRGIRPKLNMTPAQVREHARAFIQKFDGNERPMRAFTFIEYFCDNKEFRVGINQIRAANKGLRLGMAKGTL